IFFFPYLTSVRPPRVRAITFPSSICHIYILEFGQYWTLLCSASSSVPACLLCDFCSSDRGFASGFLQIPPRGGHPCPWLTVPTAKPVADFHRQVIAHAGRTRKAAGPKGPAASVCIKLSTSALQYFDIPLCSMHANSLPVFYPIGGIIHPNNCW
ncbi:hypothetical protein SAMN05216192_15338, partial [Paenibacillus typhae]